MPTIAQTYEPAFPLDQLVEHPDNANRGDEDLLDESMSALGFYGAVYAQTSTRRIIAGNHRSRVAHRRGETAVPVIFMDVDDETALRILSIDNEASRRGRNDPQALTKLLSTLAETASGLVATGFDDADLAKLLERWNRPGDPETIPPTPTKPRSKTGDLWILGNHRLLCGDSTTADDVARVLDGITPRLMVTDPPYLVDHDAGAGWDAFEGADAATAFFAAYLHHALAHLDPRAPIYQWHASSRTTLVKAAWDANDLLWHQTNFWVKSRPILTRSDFMWQIEATAYGWRRGHRPRTERRPPSNASNVWQLPSASRNEDHPTVKPLTLYTDPYTWHLRAGEWAYEPFSGSGTAIAAAEITDDRDTDLDVVELEPPTHGTGTGIAAAEVTGRRCAAIEKDPSYVDVACARWQTITGRRPVHAESGDHVDFTRSR